MQNRKLNPLELFCFNLGRLAAFNFQVEAEFNLIIPLAIIKQAVSAIQKRHYFLNVTINNDGPPEFIWHPSLEIPIEFRTADKDDAWIGLAERELNRKIEVGCNPPLRVLAVTCEEKLNLILTFDHTVADGLSGVHLLCNLVNICHQLLMGGNGIDDAVIPPAVVIEENFPDNIPTILKYYSPKRERLPGEFYADLSNRVTKFLPYYLSEIETESFSQSCKNHDVSIHSGLSAVLLLCLVEDFLSVHDVEVVEIDAVAPINLRRFLKIKIDNQQLGLAAIQLKTPHKIGRYSDLWGTAKQVQTGIERIIENNEFFTLLQTLSLKGSNSPMESFQLHERGTPNITLSNLGNVVFPDSFNFLKAKRVNVTATMNLAQSTQWGSLIVATYCSFSKRLALNFHYLEPYWNRDRAQKFVNKCIQRILDAR